MKLYIYHLPDYNTMRAVLADSQEAAIHIIGQQHSIGAALARVLSGNGDGILCPTESIILHLNKQGHE